LWDWGHLEPGDSHWGRWLGKAPARALHVEKRSTKLGPPEAPMSVRDLPRVCACADDRLVVLKMPDGSLRVHDAESGEAVSGALPVEGTPRTVEFIAGGWQLLIVEEDERRRMWDLTPDLRPAQDLLRLVQGLAG